MSFWDSKFWQELMILRGGLGAVAGVVANEGKWAVGGAFGGSLPGIMGVHTAEAFGEKGREFGFWAETAVILDALVGWISVDEGAFIKGINKFRIATNGVGESLHQVSDGLMAAWKVGQKMGMG
jgi:hypothetical protein